jgi:hypothetical protein
MDLVAASAELPTVKVIESAATIADRRTDLQVHMEHSPEKCDCAPEHIYSGSAPKLGKSSGILAIVASGDVRTIGFRASGWG